MKLRERGKAYIVELNHDKIVIQGAIFCFAIIGLIDVLTGGALWK